MLELMWDWQHPDNSRATGNVKFAPIVLSLAETHFSGVYVENLAGTLGYDNAYAVDPIDRSGGLSMFWNNEIKMECLGYSKYHIDMKVSGLGGSPWRLSCFYVQAQNHLWHRRWETMKYLCSLNNLPWMCFGDFNEVLRLDEHDGGAA